MRDISQCREGRPSAPRGTSVSRLRDIPRGGCSTGGQGLLPGLGQGRRARWGEAWGHVPTWQEGHTSRARWGMRNLYTSGACFQKLTLAPRPSLGARRRASRGQRLGGDFVVSRNSLSLPNTKWGVGGLLTTHSYTIQLCRMTRYIQTALPTARYSSCSARDKEPPYPHYTANGLLVRTRSSYRIILH